MNTVAVPPPTCRYRKAFLVLVGISLFADIVNLSRNDEGKLGYLIMLFVDAFGIFAGWTYHSTFLKVFAGMKSLTILISIAVFAQFVSDIQTLSDLFGPVIQDELNRILVRAIIIFVISCSAYISNVVSAWYYWRFLDSPEGVIFLQWIQAQKNTVLVNQVQLEPVEPVKEEA
ncbi:hypothetical protein HDV04_002149 [Boothiomyces sp. JEL0838]|nr:hypothetical protein HDV04_002149 [Boothiomyces sp. JEL0838]